MLVWFLRFIDTRETLSLFLTRHTCPLSRHISPLSRRWFSLYVRYSETADRFLLYNIFKMLRHDTRASAAFKSTATFYHATSFTRHSAHHDSCRYRQDDQNTAHSPSPRCMMFSLPLIFLSLSLSIKCSRWAWFHLLRLVGFYRSYASLRDISFYFTVYRRLIV